MGEIDKLVKQITVPNLEELVPQAIRVLSIWLDINHIPEKLHSTVFKQLEILMVQDLMHPHHAAEIMRKVCTLTVENVQGHEERLMVLRQLVKILRNPRYGSTYKEGRGNFPKGAMEVRANLYRIVYTYTDEKVTVVDIDKRDRIYRNRENGFRSN